VAAVYQWVYGVGSDDIIHADPLHRLVIGSGPNCSGRYNKVLMLDYG